MSTLLDHDFPPLSKVENTEPSHGLKLLREPFPAHQISTFPKNAGQRAGLSYVGHAALTDRLLDADPAWSWEPLSVDPRGLPMIDDEGGMWIRLTVCVITRLGYGDAQGKTGGNAMKERIGDALRNAAMRFGAALDLWHKGELHVDDHTPKPEVAKPSVAKPRLPPCEDKSIDRWFSNIESGKAQACNLMDFAKSKFTLSDVQEGRILAFVASKQNPPIDSEFTAEYEGAEK
jgi:hypothetical protein